MKMYILIKDDVPLNKIPVICAHASLSAYIKFKDDADVIKWERESFKKMICHVNNAEFENAKHIMNNHIITESSLDGNEVAIVLLPRTEFPKCVKYYRLLKIN